jgi:hypothetical protein
MTTQTSQEFATELRKLRIANRLQAIFLGIATVFAVILIVAG